MAWVRTRSPVAGDVLRLVEVSLKQRFTEPPLHLSESELLALMDRHGIGAQRETKRKIKNESYSKILITLLNK